MFPISCKKFFKANIGHFIFEHGSAEGPHGAEKDEKLPPSTPPAAKEGGFRSFLASAREKIGTAVTDVKDGKKSPVEIARDAAKATVDTAEKSADKVQKAAQEAGKDIASGLRRVNFRDIAMGVVEDSMLPSLVNIQTFQDEKAIQKAEQKATAESDERARQAILKAQREPVFRNPNDDGPPAAPVFRVPPD